MAEQLKPRLTEPASEAVDLDNLFAFLSDVQPQSRNQIIDEIGEKMDELVEDLDVELETVIQQELEGLAQEQQIPTPPKMGLPSLPEPTEPPPPPPPVSDVPTPSSPVSPQAPKDDTTNEPIYEAVLPRDETPCVSPPPLPVPPKLPTETPHPSPPVTRTTGPVTNQPWRFNNHEEQNNSEREQRRKFRVEKKLQELSETQEKESQIEDTYHDMVEFAQSYFNAHERSPEGTLMATLTRKRQSSELIPKYEMVTYYKGNTIPNSHIHMYDPDNVNIACSVFRVKYVFFHLRLERVRFENLIEKQKIYVLYSRICVNTFAAN